jgi:hypothetical protein
MRASRIGALADVEPIGFRRLERISLVSYRRLARPDAHTLALLVLQHASQEAAAASLGINQRTLRRWLADAGISVERRTVPALPPPTPTTPRASFWRRALRLVGL